MKKLLILFTFIFLSCSMNETVEAQSNRPYWYELSWGPSNEHTYYIVFKAPKQSGEFTDFQLPMWRPGRYLFQHFAAALSHFEATDENNKALVWNKTDKHTWRVKNPAGNSIVVKYKFFANTLDAGSSLVGANQAYINPCNLFMHLKNEHDNPCTLKVNMPDSWKAATSMQTAGNKTFTTESYHDFADSPSIFSPSLKTIKFSHLNADFYIHFQGKYSATAKDEEVLVSKIKKIITEQTAIFGELPLKYYHFIYQLCPFNIRHAVEHKYCSMYALPESTADKDNEFDGLYGITSHEFWHLWNVKRIRPAAMVPYDYQNEPYTTLHWFTEGVTSYYTDLILARAGIITTEEYLNGIASLFSSLDNSYANTVISPADASFDTWLTTSPYIHPCHQTSFYSLGERVGFFLDLELRKVSGGKITLDHVFKDLYETCYLKNKGVPEDGVQKSCEKLTGKSFATFFEKYVAKPGSYNYNELLNAFGLKLETDVSSNGYQALGIERLERGNGIVIGSVKPGSDAFKGGLGPKDVIQNIDGKDVNYGNFESFFKNLAQNQEMKFVVFSEGNTKDCVVRFTGNDAIKNYRFVISDSNNALLKDWLKTKSK